MPRWKPTLSIRAVARTVCVLALAGEEFTLVQAFGAPSRSPSRRWSFYELLFTAVSFDASAAVAARSDDPSTRLVLDQARPADGIGEATGRVSGQALDGVHDDEGNRHPGQGNQ
ncbi:hypothetical protein Mpop_3851 [Methylorubrum populi BJ001]|jgi:hypothetical protein|uniref:Secreted protein n=1 Tax=Methylorubrum populi (strain ATCC BAA-705 / NCIMB 13946 / BJ001) TaxID=441620 RepID=B1Z9L4_METPB|nr:hypothetical protein Mpop_3851 [Methylorubrum populi BJ001]